MYPYIQKPAPNIVLITNWISVTIIKTKQPLLYWKYILNNIEYYC
jgi:hypothetical protein